MHLVRLTYFSRCALDKDPAGTRRELASITAKSALRNQEDGLTGALVLHDGYFAQVLEGGRRCVTQTLQRIGADPRHHSLEIIECRSIAERQFAQWSMGLARELPPAMALRYSATTRFDPASMCAESLSSLLLAVIRDEAPVRVYAHSA